MPSIRIRSLATPAVTKTTRPRRASTSATAKSATSKSPTAKTATAKRATAKKSPAAKKGSDGSDALRIILATLDDMKAEDIVTMDLAGKTSICDYMVVATGRSQRHVGSTADNVLKELAKGGIKQVRTEGMPQCDWVLLDAGDVIVHVFREEVRTFYNLEKMWTTGPAAEMAKN